MSKKKSDKAQDSKESTSCGVKAILDQSLESYDKLPMLDIIFDKFIRQLTTALRHLTSEPVEVTMDDFQSLRFKSYFDSLKKPSTIAVFKAIEWDNLGLLILENEMIFSFVDLLLGGKKNASQTKDSSSEKILTSIERVLARQIAEIVLIELSNAFDHITPVVFLFEKLESNPNFVTISRPGDAVILLSIKIEADEQVQNIDLLIPYKTIEPVKDKMKQVFLGDKFGTDHAWEQSLVQSIREIELPIEAIISNKISTVEEIAKLKIGDTVVMDHAQDKDITIYTGELQLFTGKLGKVDDKVAISIKSIVEDDEHN